MTFQIFLLTITVSKRKRNPEDILYTQEMEQKIQEMKYRQSVNLMF